MNRKWVVGGSAGVCTSAPTDEAAGGEGLTIVDEATVEEPLGGTGTGAPTEPQNVRANEMVPMVE